MQQFNGRGKKGEEKIRNILPNRKKKILNPKKTKSVDTICASTETTIPERQQYNGSQKK